MPEVVSFASMHETARDGAPIGYGRLGGGA